MEIELLGRDRGYVFETTMKCLWAELWMCLLVVGFGLGLELFGPE